MSPHVRKRVKAIVSEMKLTGAGMNAGLCENCRHVKRLVNNRGSVFYMCEKSASDPRFPRYPRLPVLRCSGFEKIQTDLPPKRDEE